MSPKINENITIDYTYNGKSLTFTKPLVMAIVNITPDSFYDGGKFDTISDVLNDIEEKLKLGADVIDIGAASSRPNSIEISEEEEWKRLQPILSEARKQFPKTFISIDTYRSSIAKKSAENGADIINDISGGNMDAEIFGTVAKIGIPYILMHMQGTPQTMQLHPTYSNVVGEIRNEFEQKIATLKQLNFNKIILDVGFGFGKTTEHNYQLLKHLSNFKKLGFPVLAGLSRKSMINKVIGTNPVTALNGTTVLNTIALLNSANILRVHDITEAKQAIELVNFYNNS
ncbi:MAG: dihydropteroate synthase [Bacteroidota bacterium]|nr:dihydropteroate synthase [Bacteroidota bacterium]